MSDRPPDSPRCKRCNKSIHAVSNGLNVGCRCKSQLQTLKERHGFKILLTHHAVWQCPECDRPVSEDKFDEKWSDAEINQLLSSPICVLCRRKK